MPRKGRRRGRYLGEAVLVAVGVRHFAAVVDGQLLGIDLFEHRLGPLFLVVGEHFDLVLRPLVQERLDHGKRQAEDLGRWKHSNSASRLRISRVKSYRSRRRRA